MIKLEVEEYCHSCLDFEADVKKAERVRNGHGDMILGDTVVRCAHRNRCLNIKRYLERQTKEEVAG